MIQTISQLFPQKSRCLRATISLFMAGCVVGFSLATAQASRVPNADVEIDVDMDGTPDDWFRGPNTDYVDNDDSNGVGTHSLQFRGPNTDWRSSEFDVVAGETISWSVDYKFLSSASGQIRADLRFFEGPGNFNFQGEDAVIIDVSNPDAWQTLGPRDIAVPGVASFADIRVSSFFGSGFSGEVRLDNFSVIPEPSAILPSGLALAAVFGCRRRFRSAA